MSQQPQKTIDGPATVFEVDPKVSDIFTCQDGDYYGLVLVAGWPPEETVDAPYQTFLQYVRGCFEDYPSDLLSSQVDDDGQTLPAAVYLYPTIHLHVTIATFAPPERNQHKDVKDYYADFQAARQNLVKEASKLPEWPKGPIRLVIDSTQLGSKAGILLWRDESGGIAAIRKCLQTAVANQNDDDDHLHIHAIPGIIHSTFLRFSQVPRTPGETVQERYLSNVVPNVSKIFHAPILAKTVKLVCESTPYMHVPDDEQHVLLNISLTDE
jgi:hypothetical protein